MAGPACTADRATARRAGRSAAAAGRPTRPAQLAGRKPTRPVGPAVRAAVCDASYAAPARRGLSLAHGNRFFSAHSTRSGFAAQAAANGASERPIMDQGRWQSLQMAHSYIRRGSVFTDNAPGRLGL